MGLMACTIRFGRQLAIPTKMLPRRREENAQRSDKHNIIYIVNKSVAL